MERKDDERELDGRKMRNKDEKPRRWERNNGKIMQII